MQLLDLTPDELAFLALPHDRPDDLLPRLTHKLCTTLSARLRLPLQAVARAPATGDPEAVSMGTLPCWQPDRTLATLWLTRRLGGRHLFGAASFVPAGLLHTLDAVLAESWIDGRGQPLPGHIEWLLTTPLTQATLTLQMPQDASDMRRWAREVIRRG